MADDKAKLEENLEKLKRAGFGIKVPLPREYEEVLEELSPEEVDLLIGMKQRLEEAERSTPPEVGSYTNYFFHPPF